MLLLLLTMALDYADRALIGALGPTLKRTFDLNNTELGLLAAASTIVAALATLPIGILTDRVRRTRLLVISLALWSVAMVLTGASVVFLMLFVSRLFLGAVTATSGPVVPSLVGDIVPANRRAKALGEINSGQLVGTGVGIILAAVITAFLSFRWCFWLLAAAGAGAALAFARLPEPTRTGAAGPGGEEQPHTRVQQILLNRGAQPRREAILREDPAQMSMWDAARYVLRVRTDVVVLVSRAISDYFFLGVSTFGVVFATKEYRVSERQADIAILVLGIGAVAGFLVGGRLGDALLRRGYVNSRVWIGAIGYLVSPVVVLPAILTHSLFVAMPLLALGASFLGATAPQLDAIRLDVIVPLLRGRAEAIRQLLRTAAEGAAPALFGLIAGHAAADEVSSLQLAFLITLPTLAVTGLILLLALRTYQPDVAAALASTEESLPDSRLSPENPRQTGPVGQRDNDRD